MKELFTSLQERLQSETPTWFKGIAWVFGVVGAVALSLVIAQGAGQLSLSPNLFEALKITAISCSAVTCVSLTAKKTTP